LTGYTNTDSTALGLYTRSEGASGTYATFFGLFAGYRVQNYYSTGVGAYCMYGSTTIHNGQYNACYGYQSGYGIAGAADQNTYIGALAGSNAAWAEYNTLIGYNTQLAVTNNIYSIVLGHDITGKGSYTAVIGKTGTGATTDTWIRSTTFHFGNEAAGDKYWFFQNSASGNQPGFKWADAVGEVQWSNDGSTWTAMGGGGGGGNTLDVVLAESTQADQLMYLDESRNTATPGVQAYICSQATKNWSGTITLESAGTWTTAFTQPYAYDACSLRADLQLIAYQFGTSLRIRAISTTWGSSPVVGTAVDLAPDGGSNDVAYVSITKLLTQAKTYNAGVIAWVNPTTNKGWIVPVTVVGTTVTAGTPINFTLTGCQGTALSSQESATATIGYGMLAWADTASNTGLSQMFSVITLSGTPVIGMHVATGAPYTFTTMAATLIGQPTLRMGGGPCSIMYGVAERRVRTGLVNYGSGSGDVFWYENSREARVDGYDVYGSAPGYVLDTSQYGTGDFFTVSGDGALLVSGTRTGFEKYLYQVSVTTDSSYYSVVGMPSHKTKVIDGGLPSGPLAGAELSKLTLRAIGHNTCAVAAVSDNAGGTPYILFGWGYFLGGELQINFDQPLWSGTPTFAPFLGAQPQHAAVLFPVSNAAFGRLFSYTYSGTNYFRLYMYQIADPRVNFMGVLQTAGNAGDTRTLSLPGYEHTFTTIGSAPLVPGQAVYMNPSSTGLYNPGCMYRTRYLIGTATATNKAIIKDPANSR